MKVSQIAAGALRRALSTSGLRIRTGPFISHVQTPLENIADGVRLFYKDFDCESEGFADFHLKLARPRNLHRVWRSQVTCSLNDESPFSPLPSDQAFAAFESLLGVMQNRGGGIDRNRRVGRQPALFPAARPVPALSAAGEGGLPLASQTR